MRVYRLEHAGAGRRLRPREERSPDPKSGEVVIRVRAASLNYRDLLVLAGGYPRNDAHDVIALSDGAGEIIDVGDGVDGWGAGDRVAVNFMRDWPAGPVTERALRSSLGGGVDGVLAEKIAVPAHALARLPDDMDFATAATLPCAGVTAWHGLRRCGVKAGDVVLTLGTGGVSIFALQFAKAMGAAVAITSSSDEKLERARAIGADHLINYRTRPDWDDALREAIPRGVDAVIETGGPGTIARSMAACAPGGAIALIGVLTDDQPDIKPVLLNALDIHGIYVGSTEMLRETLSAIEVNHIEPVIDRRFAFDEAPAAYDYLKSQKHFGKVVIDI